MRLEKDKRVLKAEYPFDLMEITLPKQESDDIPFHWHDYCEITLCLEGKGEYYTGGKKYDINPGDVVIFNNVEMHGWKNEKPMKLLVLIFATEFISIPQTHFDREYMKPFLNRSANFENKLNGLEEYVKEISVIMNNMRREWNNRESGWQLMVKAELLQILTLVIRYSKDNSDENSHKKELSNGLEAALYFVNAHYTDKISLSEAATVACMSPNYFSAVFKREMGIGFSEYITKLRLKKAQDMQMNTDMNISQIAYMCGFSNMSNYYRLKAKYND